MLNPDEGSRPLALRPILNQFGYPDRIVAPQSAAYDTPDNLVFEDKVIGSRGKLDEAVAHAEFLPDRSSRSIHSWAIAMTASRSCATNTVGRCFGNATKAIQSTPVRLSLI
jgi:hypothetical protein